MEDPTVTPSAPEQPAGVPVQDNPASVPAPATEEVQPPLEEARPDSTNLAAPVPDSAPETPQPEPVTSEPTPIAETPPTEVPAENSPISPTPPNPPDIPNIPDIPKPVEETPAPQPQPPPLPITPAEIPIPNFRFPFNGDFPVSFPFNAAPITDEMKGKFAKWGISGHHGVDFGLPEGTEVLAVDSGKILQSSENGDYGNSVTVQHSWGQSLYAHLKETKVTEDQEVNTGDVVGISGQTGAAFGPHLHFGLKPNHPNEANGFLGFIDPTQYFPPISQIPQTPQISQPEIPPVPEPTIINSIDINELRQKANQARTDQRSERLKKIVSFIQVHGPVTNQDIRDLLHVSQSTATDYLNDLVNRGILKIEGKSSAVKYSY